MVDVKNSVSKEEWEVRTDLAAFYRTVPYFGWDDLIFTHISTGGGSTLELLSGLELPALQGMEF